MNEERTAEPAQRWECKRCGTSQDTALPASFVACAKGHPMKKVFDRRAVVAGKDKR